MTDEDRAQALREAAGGDDLAHPVGDVVETAPVDPDLELVDHAGAESIRRDCDSLMPMVLMSIGELPHRSTPSATAPAAVAGPPYVPDPARVEKLRRQMTHGLLWRLFMLGKLPLGLFAGIRVKELDVARCVATVPYGWRSTNPFQSTYFAALAMAAELSTGALALMAARCAPRSVALLIVDLDARFEEGGGDHGLHLRAG